MSAFFKFFLFIIILTLFGCSKNNKPVKAKNGMVVSASSIASDVGIEILKKGGNAVDAAVATGFALAVTYPQAGNIGGGGFMVINLANGIKTTIDYREKAPKSAFKDMFLDSDGNYDPIKAQKSISSSGVPGSVAGLLYALNKYGKLSLSDVISPAIKLAKNGFELSKSLANSFNAYSEQFQKYPSSKRIFIRTNKWNKGDKFIQTDLAETLQRIVKYGLNGFYDGKTAELIAQQSNKMSGFLTLEDLKNYSPVERKPVIGNYKGFEIISMGPPSSGGIAIIEALNSIEKFSFNSDDWNSSKYIHTLTEILKHVYSDRSKYLGDKDFYDVPISELISKKRGELISKLVNEKAVPSKMINGIPINNIESEETTHYSVVDKFGNAVSVTTTLNSSFGNKIVVDGAGFLFNNEMDDFSSKPGVPNQFGLVGGAANSIEPNKRMLSSMSPTIITKNNTPFMVIGSPGGSTIITVVLQVILNVIDFDMNIKEAIDAPRFHHQWLPDRIDYEKSAISSTVREELIEKGQIIGKVRSLGRAEGIILGKDFIYGATDRRGDGGAKGY